MKHLFLKFVVLLLTVGLVACSSNTNNQNTGIGAVTGAVVGGLAGSLFGGGTGKVVAVGVGAVAGALMGGAVGHSMDSSDSTRTYQTLNNSSTNKPHYWRNTRTGTAYTVTPTSNRFTVNGNPNCRHYRTTALINGKSQQVSGTACKQADGSWVAINR